MLSPFSLVGQEWLQASARDGISMRLRHRLRLVVSVILDGQGDRDRYSRRDLVVMALCSVRQ